MTHATKSVLRVLLSDSIRLAPRGATSADTTGGGFALYDEADLAACMDRIEVIDFHQVVEAAGIKFWCYNAGHVLGAAMFMIDAGGTKLLYTGDYSLEEDRHLMPAEVPRVSPDVLIMECTYGTQKHEARDVREALFVSTIERVVQRGGRVLLPVFALGRAQELLLILEEHWRDRGLELSRVPVYYASKLATRALRVYQTYVNMMNAHVQRQLDVANPFQFNTVQNLARLDELDDSGPCVVLASPGMLQSGVSRQLFERWCSDNRNAVVLAGYAVEGTLAKQLATEPEEITALDGRILKRNCTVVSVSFSAHTDYKQNATFVRATSPGAVILVHGEKHEMNRFKNQLLSDANKWPPEDRPTVSSPENGQKVLVRFPADAKVLLRHGADEKGDQTFFDSNKRQRTASLNKTIDPGVLVVKELQTTFYTDAQLDASTLTVVEIDQTLRLRLSAAAAEGLLSALRRTFYDVKLESAESSLRNDPKLQRLLKLNVCGHVSCLLITDEHAQNHLILNWRAAPVSDVLADAVAYLALHTGKVPTAGLLSTDCCAPSSYPPPEQEEQQQLPDTYSIVFNLVKKTLIDHFGSDLVEVLPNEIDHNPDIKPMIDENEEEAHQNDPVPLLRLRIIHDEASAICTLFDHGAPRFRVDVASDDDALRHRLQRLLTHILAASTPIDVTGRETSTFTFPPDAIKAVSQDN